MRLGPLRRLVVRLAVALARAQAPPLPPELVDCPDCRGDFACPVAWCEIDETHWWIRLRCGECGYEREVEVTDEEAAALDRALSLHTEQIERAVARLDRERMQLEVELLIAAFEHDLVDPSSFERGTA
jgi:hypothetical protein